MAEFIFPGLLAGQAAATILFGIFWNMLSGDGGKILREETKFWVVQPQLSVNRVQNLETIIKGTHITFKPGTGEFRNDFVVVEQPQEEDNKDQRTP